MTRILFLTLGGLAKVIRQLPLVLLGRIAALYNHHYHRSSSLTATIWYHATCGTITPRRCTHLPLQSSNHPYLPSLHLVLLLPSTWWGTVPSTIRFLFTGFCPRGALGSLSWLIHGQTIIETDRPPCQRHNYSLAAFYAYVSLAVPCRDYKVLSEPDRHEKFRVGKPAKCDKISMAGTASVTRLVTG